MPEKDYYSVEEAAAKIGVHQDTIRNYIRTGQLKATRLGTQSRPFYRIKKVDFEEFLRKREIGGDNGHTGEH